MIVLQENRENPRLNIYVSSTVSCKDEEKEFFSIVRNISSTGAYITTNEQFEEGCFADFSISLDDRAISFEGEFVRTQDADSRYGYGIQITDIDNEDKENLNTFIYRTFYEMTNKYSDSETEQLFESNLLSDDDGFLHDSQLHDFSFIETDGIQSRMLQAGFPFQAEVEDYDFNLQSSEAKELIESALSLDWIEHAKNIMLFGATGAGKTHLAIGLGRKAIEQGYKVSFTTMETLLSYIKTERLLSKSKFRLNSIFESRVVIIDDAGLLPLSQEDSNLFYQFLNKIYGRTSILMTSDMTFEQWMQAVGNSDKVNLLLNRLAYNIELKSLLN